MSLTRWSWGQEHLRGLYSHHFCSLYTTELSNTIQVLTTIPMTLELWVVFVWDRGLSTVNWKTALCHGQETIILS